MNRQIMGVVAFVCSVGLGTSSLLAQAEVSGWGNLRGMRVNDELIPFTTAVGMYDPTFSTLTLSQREGPVRTTRYQRDGQTVTVGVHLRYGNAPTTRPAPATTTRGVTTTRAARGNGGGRGPQPPGLDYTIAYDDVAPGECKVSVDLTSATALPTGGVYYVLTLPGASVAGATAQVIGGGDAASVPLSSSPDARGRLLAGNGTGLRLTTKDNKTIELDFAAAGDVVVQPVPKRRAASQPADDDAANEPADVQVMVPILAGQVAAGQHTTATFTIKASGAADVRPVTVALDAAKTGRPFDGIGGNFRIQSDRDPTHIGYMLEHVRCAYGRVAMPWNVWQPDENAQPPMLASASSTTQPAAVGMNSIVSAMEIAQRLSKLNVPMVISVWQPPRWATLPDDGRGYPGSMRLDPAKWDAICQSIGSYLLYLRDHYGAEPELFSFNESNLGINVRQTPEDHLDAIKHLGAHFKAIGLKTKILLGDTSDVPPVKFVQPAIDDPAARPFIGAISFHSWRGATDAQYQRWADAAAKLNVPLLDAEGGNDAQAYGYPAVFREPFYALDEAAEYVRIMRICQPRSILQWQFTSDYSVLVVDPDGTIHPTQRFFNLKQINAMPAGSNWIDATSSSPSVYAAAFDKSDAGVCTVHLVNDGAKRTTTLSGLPASATKLTAYVTDATRGMEPMPDVAVTNGSATLDLPACAFVTLISSGK